MSEAINSYGTVKTFYDRECRSHYEDCFTIDVNTQNCGDANITVSSGGNDGYRETFFDFSLSQDKIDMLIAELQKCKAQKIKWDEKHGNKQ